MKTQHITILHSNDIHSDYSHKNKDGSAREKGGIAYLAGYIEQKREAAPESTIYAFAGDMFNGSLIDSLSYGSESINILNMLKPEVATIGNHELDYQLSCISYYKDRCYFPLICANLYDKFNEELYFTPYHIQPVGDVNILFIGVVTKEVEQRAGKDLMVDLQMDWLEPIDQITACYEECVKKTHIDITVVLSHLGIEVDRELAKALNAQNKVKVDLIIGGHSHTDLDEEEEVGPIRIVQAGTGTAQIGRCEIDYDLEEKRISHFDWDCDPIENKKITPNKTLKDLIDKLEKEISKKYGKTLTTLKKEDASGAELIPVNAEHSNRYKTTEVGNLICDALAERYGLDLVFIGSGSLRKKMLDTNVTRADMMEMYSYADEKLYAIWMNGKEIKDAARFFLGNAPVYDPDDKNDYHMEFFQVNLGYYFEYDSTVTDGDKLVKATYRNQTIEDDDWFRVGIEGFHLKNMITSLGLNPDDEIKKRQRDGMGKKEKTSSIQYTLKDYMRNKDYLQILSDVRVMKK